MTLYANEWTWDTEQNTSHYRHLIDIVESHHCELLFDLALAQGIDVNALGLNGQTALCVTCERDEYAWATKKLIDHPLCNVNVAWGMYGSTPLGGILFSSDPDVHIKNMRILLTRADLTIGDLWAWVKNITDGKVKNLFLTAYPFLDEQK